MRSLAKLALWAPVGLGLFAWACSGEERPPLFQPLPSTGGAGGLALDASTSDGPPPADAAGLCGNLIHPVILERPNLYFVLDRSGSMQAPVPGTSQTKFVAAQLAISEVLSILGHRVRYGAAVFPFSGGPIEGCAAGGEVFPTVEGDPPSYAAQGKTGPVLVSFLQTIANYPPEGGTPTAPTIAAVNPILTALPGKTVVVLATDGSPNCNAFASCTSLDCQHTVEGTSIQGKPCSASYNCCDPALVEGGQLYCVDDDPTATAIGELAAAGVDTYVIGLPGSEYYSAVLDQFAIAGNTARPTPPLYYPTASTEELADAVREIGVKVAVSCTITLDSAPPDENLVNVYLDSALVGYDEENGWAWLSQTTLELRGEACAKLKSGDVLQVQVVSGCPTRIR